MYLIALYAYLAFLAVIWVGLMAVGIRPHRAERYKTSPRYKPHVLLMVPCRGVDIGLEDNLRSLKGQSYSNYEMVAIVDSKNDAALPAIKRIGIKYLVSDYRSKGSGKVRALCTAMAKYKNYDVYAVADSDIRAGSNWLSEVVAPLYDRSVGVSTAFELFEPVGGFWSRAKAVWGLAGQGLMEYKLTRFAWGGTMAFRKDLLDSNDFKGFSDSVSDDTFIGNAAKAKGLKIAYVASANPTVRTKDNYREFKDWSNRQVRFAIYGNRMVLYYAIIYYAACVLLLFSALLVAALVNALALLYLIPLIIGALKSYQRRPSSISLLVHPFIDIIFLSNIWVAARMTSYSWRGRRYEIR